MERSRGSLRQVQTRTEVPSAFLVAGLVYLPALLLLLAVLLVRLLSDPLISFDYMMRDPAAIAEEAFYLGVVSNAGVIFWTASAAVCLFAAGALRGENEPRYSRFFLFAGLLSALLTFDDAFLLHEEVFPEYLSASKNLVLSSYGILFLLFAFIFRRLILRTSYPLLVLAGLFFATSLIVDVAEENSLVTLAGLVFVEDGSKFLGIAGWLSYCSATALWAMRTRTC